MKKTILLLLMACSMLVITSCSKDDDIAATQSEETEYAMLVYGTVGGKMDNLIEDIWEETQKLLPDKKVRVFCLHKYGKDSEKYAGKYGMPGELVVFELTKDTKFEEISEKEKGVFDKFPLYEPACLTAALNMMKEMAPAKQYVLTLFGHGGGFDVNVDYPQEWITGDKGNISTAGTRGVLYDEWMVSNKGMNMYQLSEAIDNSQIPHLKALVFHNCLMAGAEILMEAQPYADYIIATPFLMTSEDNPLIPTLVRNMRKSNDFEQVARQSVLDCKDRMTEGFKKEDTEGMNGNLELFKTSKMLDISSTAGKLSKRLCELYPTQKANIDRATDGAYRFFNQLPYFDLLHYAQLLAKETGDEQLKAIYEELGGHFKQTILEQVTIDLGVNPALPSYSLSIQLTDKDAYCKQIPNTNFTVRDVYMYSDFNIISGWGTWLETNERKPTGNPCGQVE